MKSTVDRSLAMRTSVFVGLRDEIVHNFMPTLIIAGINLALIYRIIAQQ